jgi:RNA polymerase sigma-70 factor (ECF subfamily)
LTDNELITGIKNGDQLAFKLLVEKYQQSIIRTCLGLLQDYDDAQDIAQEVFVEVFQSIQKFRSDSSIATWLYRIAVNKSINLLKKNRRKRWVMNFESFISGKQLSETLPAGKQSIPENQMILAEELRLLRDAISNLPDNQRIAFTLHKYEELPYKQIAEVMDVSLSSVESLIFRAKSGLKKKLSAD